MTFNAPNATTVAGIEGLLKKFAIGGGLTAAMALYLYEIVSHNPQASFALLGQFGPGFLLGMVSLVLAWHLLTIALGHLGELSRSVATNATSMQTLSDAVAKIAAKDDRQFEEMRLVAQFNAENSNRILKMTSDMGEHLQAQDRQMQEQVKQLQEHGRQLQSISDRIGHTGAK